MLKLTFRKYGQEDTTTVETLAYAVIHELDGVYLHYAPEGVTSMKETFTDVVEKLDEANHFVSAETIQ